MEDTFPLTTTEFEAFQMPIPGNVHAALTLKYGDYMRMPDIDKIMPHVGKLEIYE